jgi:hypothetical protein
MAKIENFAAAELVTRDALCDIVTKRVSINRARRASRDIEMSNIKAAINLAHSPGYTTLAFSRDGA